MKNQKLLFTLVICLIISPFFTTSSSTEETDVYELFSVSLMSPNIGRSSPWGMLMEHQLPKIGIGVDFHSTTYWPNIASRTWDYPLIEYDYIPTYDEGGFDILFNRILWSLDPDIKGMFDSASIVPWDMNFYQYSNPLYDAKLQKYLVELNPTLKTEYFQQMQSILYEDLPAISVLYGNILFGVAGTVTGVDWDLVYDSSQRPELWNNTDDQSLVYSVGSYLKAPNMFLLGQNKMWDYTDAQWMNAVYGRLFQRTQTTKYWESEIALDYTISSDLLNYTVFIDPNAKFSDGEPVLAEDVEYSFELHLTPSVNSTKYDELKNWFSTNDSIEVIDTHTINFNFSSFCYNPLNVLSEGIIDKSEVESLVSAFDYSIFTEVPLTGNVTDSLVKSCGPFTLDSYEPMNNNTVKMLPNIFWNNLTSSGGNNPYLLELNHTGLPYKDAAVTAMEMGLVDIIGPFYWSAKTDYQDKPQMHYVLAKTGYQTDISINMKHPIMGTGELTPNGTSEAAKYIRKAISHVVPKNIIIEHSFEGFAVEGTSPIADSCIGYNESMEPYTYDLELAIDYIEQAGFQVRKTPTKTNFIQLLTMVIGLTTIIGIRKRRR